MGINLTVPISAQVHQTANIFQANFNVPTLNRYDFTNTAGNANQVVLALDRWSVYIIERINFSGNITEGNYGEAIDQNAGLPTFQLRTVVANQQIFPNWQPVINYVDNLETQQVFWSQQDNDSLLCTYRGLFAQTAAMAGLVTMYTYLQFQIFKISETDWVRRFMDYKTELGTGLNVRGH